MLSGDHKKQGFHHSIDESQSKFQESPSPFIIAQERVPCPGEEFDKDNSSSFQPSLNSVSRNNLEDILNQSRELGNSALQGSKGSNHINISIVE
jgi:hypothetical protein